MIGEIFDIFGLLAVIIAACIFIYASVDSVKKRFRDKDSRRSEDLLSIIIAFSVHFLYIAGGVFAIIFSIFLLYREFAN